MAYLDKDAYFGKQLYAERKMAKNAEIDTLTEEQHEVLAELCRIRHEFHSTDSDKYFNSESQYNLEEVFSPKGDSIYSQLEEVDLPSLSELDFDELPSSSEWDWLDEDEQQEWENKAEELNKKETGHFIYTGYELWKEEVMENFDKFLSDYNEVIEDYLRKIDEKYGTEYCPTGIARNREILGDGYIKPNAIISEIEEDTKQKIINSETIEGLTYVMYINDGSGAAMLNGETIGEVDLAAKEIKIGNGSWTPMPYESVDNIKEIFMKTCEEKAVEMGANYLLKTPEEILAIQIDELMRNYDPYDYNDQVDSREDNVRMIAEDIKNGNVSDIKSILSDIIEDDDISEEDLNEVKELIDRLPERKNEFVVVIDTETTGLNPEENELLQVSIIDGAGNNLFNSYFKPTVATSWEAAEQINGISPAMVQDAPLISDKINEINDIINRADKIIGYNTGFDLNFLKHNGLKIEKKDDQVVDVMKDFAQIYGQWNDSYQTYKWQKLTTAAAYYDYDWNSHPECAHNSLADCYATLHVYDKINEYEANKVKKINEYRDRTNSCFKEIDEKSASDIEELVKSHIQDILDSNSIRADIIDVVLVGSRSRGLEKENSDIDLAVEFRGDVTEDMLFNILNEDKMSIGGYKIDINPITADKTGTLLEYLIEAEDYLAEKEQANVIYTPEDSILYVAEDEEIKFLILEEVSTHDIIRFGWDVTDKDIADFMKKYENEGLTEDDFESNNWLDHSEIEKNPVTRIAGLEKERQQVHIPLYSLSDFANIKYISSECNENEELYTFEANICGNKNTIRYEVKNDSDGKEKSFLIATKHCSLVDEEYLSMEDLLTLKKMLSDEIKIDRYEQKIENVETREELKNICHEYIVDRTEKRDFPQEMVKRFHKAFNKKTEELLNKNNIWRVVHEADDEFDNPQQWATKIDEGKFIWIDHEEDGYGVHLTADSSSPLKTFSTLDEAKEYVDEELREQEPDLIQQAKNLINEYSLSEFDNEADFSDLEHIDLADTEWTDDETGKEHRIQVSVDLLNYRLDTWVDGDLIESNQFDSLEELSGIELSWLNFDSLITLSDKALETLHEKEINEEAAKAIDEHEAEYGADGRRVFPNLNDEWSVTANPVGGEMLYSVYRLIDRTAVDHSSNRENPCSYFPDRSLMIKLADELNANCIIELNEAKEYSDKFLAEHFEKSEQQKFGVISLESRTGERAYFEITDKVDCDDVISMISKENNAYDAFEKAAKKINAEEYAELEQSKECRYSIDYSMITDVAAVLIINEGRGGIPEGQRNDDNISVKKVKIESARTQPNQRGKNFFDAKVDKTLKLKKLRNTSNTKKEKTRNNGERFK